MIPPLNDVHQVSSIDVEKMGANHEYLVESTSDAATYKLIHATDEPEHDVLSRREPYQ